MTRPRRPSGTDSWIVALAVAAMAMPPPPTKTMSRRETGYGRRQRPAAIEATPRMIAAERDADRPGPATDDERDRGPERTDPGRGHEEAVAGRVGLPRTSWASGGMRTLKFMPTVATRPTIDDGHQHDRRLPDVVEALARFSKTSPADRGRGSRRGGVELVVAHQRQADEHGEEAERVDARRRCRRRTPRWSGRRSPGRGRARR